MKKFISIILSTALVLLCVTSVSADRVIYGLSEIGTFEVNRNPAIGYGITYKAGDKNINIDNNYINDSELDYLLWVFSDENLISTNSEPGNEIVTSTHPDFPKYASLSFLTTEDLNVDIYFDNTNVLIIHVNPENDEIHQGWFKYNSSELFNELSDFIETLIVNMQKTQEESKDELYKNKNAVSVSNFEILYRCSFPLGNFSDEFVWGVCRYTREGETEPVTVFYHSYLDTDEHKMFSISENLLKESNTVIFNNERELVLEDGKTATTELDSLASLIYDYKIQVNVTENTKIESIAATYQHQNSSTPTTETIDMNTVTESGRLPQSLFSSYNNVQYLGDENKVTSFEKLYSQELTTNASYMKNLQWGVCTYESKMSGKVKAFFLYLADEDVYLLSSIQKISPDFHTYIVFKNHAIEDGYEIFNHNKYNVQLTLGIPNPNQIGYYRITEINGSKHITITNIGKAIGSLDCLEFLPGKNEQNQEEVSNDTKENENHTTEEKNEQKAEIKDNTDETSTEKETTVNENETIKEEVAEKEDTSIKEELTKEDSSVKEDETIKEDITEAENTKDDSMILAFADVPSTHWAHDEIMDFAQNKIVLGYGNGLFGVNDSISYDHFALLLDRLFGYKAENTLSAPAIREDIIVSVVKALEIDVTKADESIISNTFSDCEKIKEENKKYIAAAIEKGLVIGSDGKLFPESNLTRAETVVLLARAINY